MAIISLYNITLNVGGNRLLNEVNWAIEPKDRIALVGRNGAGKSSLLKLLQGIYTSDKGQINKQSGMTIAGLVQDVPTFETHEKVYYFLVQGLGRAGLAIYDYQEALLSGDMEKLADNQKIIDDLQAWEYITEVQTMASKLGIDPSQNMKSLSGGMKRRVLLAAALIAKPDLLLLDEPTNHLDLPSIEWLESYLKSYNGSLVVVTHDRAFLAQVANTIVEIDRGNLYTHVCDYDTYLDRREAIRLAEDKKNALFDKKLAEEEVWIRTGIRARRTRNEGRVRALEEMRKNHKARVEQLGKVKNLQIDASARSGNLVIEAQNLNFNIDERTLLKDFSLILTKGDKIGIIGPNGCGKTTLIRLLLGELKPSSGTVKQGTSLAVAYFDQLRSQLDDAQTLMYNVGDGSDYVTINGKQKHVASYLSDFLFSADRFNQTVSTLSGGERNRLLLAKLLAKPVNLLVMDEPTNDLDIETLELLETMMIDYPGTLILISHDREFIDQVVTSVLVYEDEGQFNEYVGGYKDYKLNKKQQPTNVISPPIQKKNVLKVKLSYKEQKELEALPLKIENLEKQIQKMHTEMGLPEFYAKNVSEITNFNQQLSKNEKELVELYERWEYLEDE